MAARVRPQWARTDGNDLPRRGGTVVGEGGKKSKKPVLFFEGKDKPLAIGATIGKTIQAMYGPKTEGWVGKRITLFTSTTHSTGGEEVECIRVRPQIRPPPPGTSTARRPSEPEAPGAGFPVEDESEDDRARRLAGAHRRRGSAVSVAIDMPDDAHLAQPVVDPDGVRFQPAQAVR
jgi:hypothetical protein